MDVQLSLYSALLSINVPEEKALNVVNALEHDMQNLATKQDIGLLQRDMERLKLELTVRMGGMLAVSVGILAALIKLG